MIILECETVIELNGRLMSDEKKEEKKDETVRDLPVQKDVKGGDGGNASKSIDPVRLPPVTDPKIIQ